MAYPAYNLTLFHLLTHRDLNRACLQMNQGCKYTFAVLQDDVIAGDCLFVVFVWVKITRVLIGTRQVGQQIGFRRFRAAVFCCHNDPITGGIYVLPPTIILF